MPHSRVALVTIATSPRFVPEQALSLVNELVEFIIRDSSNTIENSPPEMPASRPDSQRYIRQECVTHPDSAKTIM
ncbi:MAG TPA: hypothetical protein GX507_05200 [Clostridia bacterium]|nr:hypothetical protein [Clostridia bacterium]